MSKQLELFNESLKTNQEIFDKYNAKVIERLALTASSNSRSSVPAAKLFFQLQGWSEKTRTENETRIEVNIPIINWV